VIVERVTGAAEAVNSVTTTKELMKLQAECRKVYVDPPLMQYAVKLIAATRDPSKAGLGNLSRYLMFGASPRATIHLIEASKALAYLRGRKYVLPDDVIDLAADVIRHRLVLSYEALSENMTADRLIQNILRSIPVPEKPMESHADI
jgi:MoxR-like ATPase